MKYVITIRGERELWLDFVHKTKKEKKKVWDVLGPFLRKYASADDENRVLLILFPKELIEELFGKDDPDGFIKDAIENAMISSNVQEQKTVSESARTLFDKYKERSDIKVLHAEIRAIKT